MTPPVHLDPASILDLVRGWPMPDGYRLVVSFDPGENVVRVAVASGHHDEEEDGDLPYAVLPMDAIGPAGLMNVLHRLLADAMGRGTAEPLTTEEIRSWGAWSR